jgi:hypothetical protein
MAMLIRLLLTLLVILGRTLHLSMILIMIPLLIIMGNIVLRNYARLLDVVILN